MTDSGSNFLIKALLNIIKKPADINTKARCQTKDCGGDRPISCQVLAYIILQAHLE